MQIQCIKEQAAQATLTGAYKRCKKNPQQRHFSTNQYCFPNYHEVESTQSS